MRFLQAYVINLAHFNLMMSYSKSMVIIFKTISSPLGKAELLRFCPTQLLSKFSYHRLYSESNLKPFLRASSLLFQSSSHTSPQSPFAWRTRYENNAKRFFSQCSNECVVDTMLPKWNFDSMNTISSIITLC